MRILVVEDKEMHCQSARETLSGHEVTIVKSFDEAMKLMGRNIDQRNVQRLLAEAGFPTSPDSTPDSKYEEWWGAYRKAYGKAEAESVIPFQAGGFLFFKPLSYLKTFDIIFQ